MRTGGNDKCNIFLSKYKMGKKDNVKTNIQEKYNSAAALLYKNRIRAEIDGKPLPTELPKVSSSASDGGSGDVEPLNGETEQAYVARQKKNKQAAEERLRAKFGDKNGGASSRMQGIGSDASYVPGGGGNNDAFTLKGIGLDIDTNNLKDNATKALDTTWSFLGSAVSKLGEQVNQIAADVVDGKNDNDGGGNQQGSSSNAETNEDENWDFLSNGAANLWTQATKATSEIARKLQETDDDDEDGFAFPRRGLSQASSGKMTGIGSSDFDPASREQDTMDRSIKSKNSMNSMNSSIPSSGSDSSLGVKGLSLERQTSNTDEKLNTVTSGNEVKSPRGDNMPTKSANSSDSDFFGEFGI
jgi:hypothetical protein